MAVPDWGALAGHPGRFGHWNSIYQRFSDWSRDGTWARLLGTVQGAAEAKGEVEWIVSVDPTITCVHQHGATLARDTGGWVELHESLSFAAAISSRLIMRSVALVAV